MHVYTTVVIYFELYACARALVAVHDFGAVKSGANEHKRSTMDERG